MNKNIWHTSNEKPKQLRYYLEEYNKFSDRVGYLVNMRYGVWNTIDDLTTKRWCYLDDLLALEPELDRTRRALDDARNGLEYIFGYEGVPKYVVKHIRQVLDQIKNETAKKSAFVHNKIEFPEYNDGLLEEFDKQFFENGQDDDLTETALEQKDVK